MSTLNPTPKFPAREVNIAKHFAKTLNVFQEIVKSIEKSAGSTTLGVMATSKNLDKTQASARHIAAVFGFDVSDVYLYVGYSP